MSDLGDRRACAAGEDDPGSGVEDRAGAVSVLATAYAPMLIWPVALTVALVGYWKRRAG
ncbi:MULTISPECIES: hypothetical protein [Actinomyces]|uniref:Uncharacterized protein n=1 Tax=Actinomyces respiraculi TaxID=2744574 RepID=A0A7T0LMU2_9ACTO|nr:MULTISPECIES: hypothetical protein [Actinomyces]QPL06253.1 hypothetical protein ID810_04950 [Actinomyces respiraculi]